jgi:CRP-like cAMP-binding protein
MLEPRHDALTAVQEEPCSAGLDEESGCGRVGLGLCGSAPDDGQAQEHSLPVGCGIAGSWRVWTVAVQFLHDLVGVSRLTRTLTSGRTITQRWISDYDESVIEARPPTEALSNMPLFRGLDDGALESIARGLRARRFRRGEVIFHLGDPGDALFIVSSGAVKITLPSETGEEAILATLRPGDFFGELALLDGAPRSATAAALEPTETLVLPRQRFRDLIATEPVIRDALLASLAAELRRLTLHVEELHFLDIAGRLAARLVRLAGEQGTRRADGTIRLDAPLTQSDLASMVGCTRQSVNKLLGMFADDGLVRLDRDAIVILDQEGLARASRR